MVLEAQLACVIHALAEVLSPDDCMEAMMNLCPARERMAASMTLAAYEYIMVRYLRFSRDSETYRRVMPGIRAAARGLSPRVLGARIRESVGKASPKEWLSGLLQVHWLYYVHMIEVESELWRRQQSRSGQRRSP